MQHFPSTPHCISFPQAPLHTPSLPHSRSPSPPRSLRIPALSFLCFSLFYTLCRSHCKPSLKPNSDPTHSLFTQQGKPGEGAKTCGSALVRARGLGMGLVSALPWEYCWWLGPPWPQTWVCDWDWGWGWVWGWYLHLPGAWAWPGARSGVEASQNRQPQGGGAMSRHVTMARSLRRTADQKKTSKQTVRHCSLPLFYSSSFPQGGLTADLLKHLLEWQ